MPPAAPAAPAPPPRWRAAGAALRRLDDAAPAPLRIRGRGPLGELARNARPGLTVALVSIPLSISLALASGAGPTEGVITAAFGGVTSAAFGGCEFNVFGATGALAGIFSRFAVVYGTGVQPLLAVLAGGWCLALGGLGLHAAIDLVPGEALTGFGLAISVILVVSQLNFALGLPPGALAPRGSTLGNLGETLTHLHLTSWGAPVTFGAAFAANYAAARWAPRAPAAIVLAAGGMGLGAALEAAGADTGGGGGGGPPGLHGFTVQTLGGVYGDLGRSIVAPPAFLTGGGLPPQAWAGGADALRFWGDVVGGSVSLAVIALLETLIATRMCDGLTGAVSDEPREVAACGLANVVTGFAGGLGTNAALARTLLNIDAGATSRAAGIVNGAATMVLCTALFPYFRYLPLPVVAAVLVTVSVRMVSGAAWRRLAGAGRRGGLAVAALTAAVSVAADPAVGVAAGTLLGLLLGAWAGRGGRAVATLQRRRTREGGSGGRRWVGVATAAFPGARCRPAWWGWCCGGRGGDDAPTAALQAALAAELAAGGGGDDDSGGGGCSLRLVYTLPDGMPHVAAQAHRGRLRALLAPVVEHVRARGARSPAAVEVAVAPTAVEVAVAPDGGGSSGVSDSRRGLRVDESEPASTPTALLPPPTTMPLAALPLLRVCARVAVGAGGGATAVDAATQALAQAVRETLAQLPPPAPVVAGGVKAQAPPAGAPAGAGAGATAAVITLDVRPAGGNGSRGNGNGDVDDSVDDDGG
jgi:sulfate permease, SulP family